MSLAIQKIAQEQSLRELSFIYLFISALQYITKKYSLSPPTNSKGYSRWAELHTVFG